MNLVSLVLPLSSVTIVQITPPEKAAERRDNPCKELHSSIQCALPLSLRVLSDAI